MQPYAIRKKLQAQETLLGLSNSFPTPGIISCMCKGWDFVWIDRQHGLHTFESVLNACVAAGEIGVDAVIRVAGHSVESISPYMDLAPAGVIVPMVNNPEQAQRVVDACCFPPVGDRSFGGRRIIDLHGRQYFAEEGVFVIAQIETPEALENAEKIAAVPGIDALMFGPDDMKIRMGIDIAVYPLHDRKLTDAMKRTADAAGAKGKHSLCIIPNAPDMGTAIDMGYRMIVAGADAALLSAGAEQKRKDFTKALGID